MTSRYDKITTAKDLVSEVKTHGLSTMEQDICRAQDIFGRSPVYELIALANEKQTQEDFYLILFRIWNWRDATDFYNKYTNPEDAEEMKTELQEQEKTIKGLKENIENLKEGYSKELENNRNLGKSLNEFEEENRKLEDEIIRLKAKLYDLMVGGDK